MDNERAGLVLKRQRRAEEEARQAAIASQLEANEYAEAQQAAAAWQQEYTVVLSKCAPLVGQIQATDRDLETAIERLQAAHKRAFDLLQQRRDLETQAKVINRRLSRLAGWLGIPWTQDVVDVGEPPASWRVQAFVGRPWPER